MEVQIKKTTHGAEAEIDHLWGIGCTFGIRLVQVLHQVRVGAASSFSLTVGTVSIRF